MADTPNKPAGGNEHPGMMGDGTEEQNLNQPGHPEKRIRKEEVDEAFGEKPTRKPDETRKPR